MSAAASAVVESRVYHQTPPVDPRTSETLRELVHELRQPLSSIEAIAYYVEMTLPPDQLQVRQQMHRLQELVARAESILESAATTVRKPPASASVPS